MRLFVYVILVVFFVVTIDADEKVHAASPHQKTQKLNLLLGESISGDKALSHVVLEDGGFVVAGVTASKGAGLADGWLLRFDAKGTLLWDKTFGGTEMDEFLDIIALKDGGFVLAGYTQSKGAGNSDVWIVRIDSKGDVIFDKTYGGKGWERGVQLVLLADGGIAVAGYADSKSGADYDGYVIRLDMNGGMVWERRFGTEGHEEEFYDLVITSDGGLVLVGFTNSKGAGHVDGWIVRLDGDGNLLWDKTFGGKYNDDFRAIAVSSDGGFIVAGLITRKGSGGDIWLLRLDAKGDFLWDQKFGGKKQEWSSDVAVLPDDGFVISGATTSKGAGEADAYILKLNNKGDLLWEKTYGGSKLDRATSLVVMGDGALSLAGRRILPDAQKFDGGDLWLFTILPSEMKRIQ